MTLILKQSITLIVGSFILFVSFQLVEAGGGGGSGGGGGGGQFREASATYTQSRTGAQATAQGYTSFAEATGRNYSYGVRSTYNSTYGWGYTVERNVPQRNGGNGGNSGNSNGGDGNGIFGLGLLPNPTPANNPIILQVSVDDVTVSARGELTEIPFVVTNNSTQTITNYQYTVQISSTQFANANRATALVAGGRETMRATGRFQAPSTNTTLPITVCAQVGTNTQSCDTARLIVVAPQCSDGSDNDTDSTADRNDIGCLTNPFYPSTYDPNDNNESDVATLTPPTITLEAESAFVRSNNTASVSYSVSAEYPMTCQLRGAGIDSTFNYNSGTYQRTVTTEALINKQNIALTCTPGVPAGPYESTTREITIEIIPQVQEV